MEPTQENLRAWNELHRQRAAAQTASPPPNPEALALLPELAGKRVLHVSCGSGETSAALVGRGALVTGIDVDEDVLAAARERAPGGLFLVADLHQLPSHLRRRRFDLVYAGPGSLDVVGDVPSWVVAAARVLRAGGVLFLHERHPVAECIDPTTLRWRADYFDRKWSLGDLVDALLAAGLTLRRFAELRALGSPRRQDPRVPAEFVLAAAKA
jgi:ubiquinone/menaquinone biosynthesis C-methylase UbiE